MPNHSVSRFWDKYIEKTKSYGVKPAAVRWYVRHAEAYIKANPGRRLAQHTACDVEHYLREKGRNKRLHDWQFVQIVEALKVLFTKMVHVPWSETFPWDERINQAKVLPASHATVARDYQSIDLAVLQQGLSDKGRNNSAFKQVFDTYPEHIINLVKHIRLKNYSIRTEQSYLSWFLRFVLFHSQQDPANFAETEIGAFLDYLVLKRNVASSTQAQALNALIFFYKQVLGMSFPK